MGTFLGHLVPGLALTLLGLWHIVNISRNYLLKGSSNFKSRFWHPFTASAPIFKHSELVLVFSFSIFAILTQVVGFPVIHFAFELDSIEHATMFLHLAVFSGFALLAEINHKTETLSGVVGVLAASVFGQELLLLHFHSADHVGLEGHYHWLLQLVVLVSFVSSLAATCFPTSFPASLVLAISVIFQGCWFINMGFFLWIPEFVPKGCTAQSIHPSGELVHSAVTCSSSDADSRARALANLQFSWILAGILFSTGSLCLKLAGKCPESGQHTEYEQLRCKGAELPISSLKHSVTA
ncbi:transmembrane epididymal protein 1 [Rhodamnia argentea]|uniref:Transmembrane epididymal protein 1 n=1 Tax=Rhodamnia argentea TaxID=178133 RepID=A0A8B8NRF2_9MYRT|nr:transmembrane epididymal protein 1 [Rhodamnia argentea]